LLGTIHFSIRRGHAAQNHDEGEIFFMNGLLLAAVGIGRPESEAPTRAVNGLAQAVITPLTWVAAAVIVVIAYRMSRRRGNYLPLAMVLAAAVNSLNEALFDKVFHLYWYSAGQWKLFGTYGYPQPVWVMSAYIIYYCVPGLYIIHRLERGASRQWTFKAALVTALYGATFESIAIAIGLYTYFGPHPFRLIGDYPFWLGLMEASHIAIWAMLLAAFARVLTGWRVLLAVPAFALSFCTVMFGAGGPALATINVVNPPTVLLYVGAVGTLLLAGLMVGVTSLLHPSERAARGAIERPLSIPALRDAAPAGTY
jgi:hypothetical protein